MESILLESIEKNPSWVLNSLVLEKQLVQQLIASIESNLRKEADSAIIAPNIFLLNVPSESIEAIRLKQSEIENLEKILTTAAAITNIQFRGQVDINIFPDDTLSGDAFKILAIWKDESIAPQTSETGKPTTSEIAMSAMPPKAFIIVEGTKIFILDRDITNIGRNINNQLVLDDIRVSRHHAQIRVIKGRHMLFDLDSSGGTFVNNKRISKITLHPGDVISLAGIPLVYGQDASSQIDKNNEYTPPDHVSNDSTTTIQTMSGEDEND